MSVTDRAFGIVVKYKSELVTAAQYECTGKYEQANCHHLEMRLHVCVNRDNAFFRINCAALLYKQMKNK